MILAPSLLSSDFSKLGAEVQALERAGADWIHFDVMDGHFVPNLTIGPVVVEHCRRHSRLPFDLHLMIDTPEETVERYVQAGADLVSVHVEATRHAHRTIQRLRALGAKAGLALNPATPLEHALPLLEDLDLLVIMSVNPGWGGQSFIEASIRKVEEAARLIKRAKPEVALEVDGGVTDVSGRRVAGAGATVLVAGSYVFKHPQGLATALRTLRAVTTVGRLPYAGSRRRTVGRRRGR